PPRAPAHTDPCSPPPRPCTASRPRTSPPTRRAARHFEPPESSPTAPFAADAISPQPTAAASPRSPPPPNQSPTPYARAEIPSHSYPWLPSCVRDHRIDRETTAAAYAARASPSRFQARVGPPVGLSVVLFAAWRVGDITWRRCRARGAPCLRHTANRDRW